MAYKISNTKIYKKTLKPILITLSSSSTLPVRELISVRPFVVPTDKVIIKIKAVILFNNVDDFVKNFPMFYSSNVLTACGGVFNIVLAGRASCKTDDGTTPIKCNKNSIFSAVGSSPRRLLFLCAPLVWQSGSILGILVHVGIQILLGGVNIMLADLKKDIEILRERIADLRVSL